MATKVVLDNRRTEDPELMRSRSWRSFWYGEISIGGQYDVLSWTQSMVSVLDVRPSWKNWILFRWLPVNRLPEALGKIFSPFTTPDTEIYVHGGEGGKQCEATYADGTRVPNESWTRLAADETITIRIRGQAAHTIRFSRET